MAKQTINIGTTANDGTGDPIRAAFDKVNDNFTEIYTANTGVNTGDQNLSAYATTAAVAAGYQPLDSDLTAISALTTTAYGRALLSTADAATLRSAIGVGQTDALTLGGITIGTGNAKLQYTPGGSLTLSRVSDGGVIFVANPDSNDLAIGAITTDRIRNRFTGANGANLELLGSGVLEQRNGTTKQTLRIYNTYTSAAIYERAVMDWNGPTPGNLQIGTEFLGSGSGMAARPIDFVTGGVVRMTIGATGEVTMPAGSSFGGPSSISVIGAGNIRFSGRSAIYSTADGNITLFNNFSTGFNLLTFGGTTSAFPAIKRNGTGIDIVLANDSGYAPLATGSLTSSSSISAAIGSYVMWGGGTSSRMSAPSNGVIQFTNAATTSFTRLELGEADMGIMRGAGTPENIVTAKVGSIYLRTDGGSGSSFYVKESGVSNTGWVAK